MGKFKRLFKWIIVLIWIGVIFYLSHQTSVDSHSLSRGITEIILEKIESTGLNTFDIARMHHIVRKNAHFLAYFILSILVLDALRAIGIKGYKAIIIALAICVFYAVTDEVHQLFIHGRSGEIKDILIDSAGAFLGLIIYDLFNRIKKRIFVIM